MNLIALLLATLLAAPAPASPPRAAEVNLPAIRQELLDMERNDQAARQAMLAQMGTQASTPADRKSAAEPPAAKAVLEATRAVEEIDRKHRARLREIIDKHGWPGKSLEPLDDYVRTAREFYQRFNPPAGKAKPD